MEKATNLLTVEEFCQYWNISRSSVVRLIKKGLPSIKATGVGRRILKAQATEWLLRGGGKKK